MMSNAEARREAKRKAKQAAKLAKIRAKHPDAQPTEVDWRGEIIKGNLG